MSEPDSDPLEMPDALRIISPARLIRDWRAWLGVAVSVAAVYWTIHDVDLTEVARAISSANLWIRRLFESAT